MLTYCLKYKKHTENVNSKVINTNKSKQSKFIREQVAEGLLSSLGFKTPLSKILLLGDILFWSIFDIKRMK